MFLEARWKRCEVWFERRRQRSDEGNIMLIIKISYYEKFIRFENSTTTRYFW